MCIIPAVPFVDEMCDVLKRCESDLQRIASDAVAAGDYAAARAAVALAESMAGQRANVDGGVASADAGGGTSARGAGAGHPVKEPKSRKPGTARPRPAADRYPRFIRDRDTVIKVGWSKRHAREYQHKASRASVAAFLSLLRKRTRPGRIYTLDDLTPVPLPGGGELPDYQVYLVLAWLRATGAASKHGRNGYSFKPAALAEETWAEAWDALPTPGHD